MFVDGWRSPTGTLFALAEPSVRVRAPDGTWTLDPPNPLLDHVIAIDGVDDDTVWAATDSGVLRRGSDGTWVDQGVPADPDEVRGLHVSAADDVLVLKVPGHDCDDCYPPDVPILVRWDGAAWSEETLPPVDGTVSGMAVLPDGTVLLATTVGVLRADGTPVPMSPAFDVHWLEVAPDGTVLAIGWNEVAVGTVDGLAAAGAGDPYGSWTGGWAESATELWLVSSWSDPALGPFATVVHGDGTDWAPVLTDDPAGWLQLTGGGGEVFALGARDRELALVGDADGFVVDREIWHPGFLDYIAVDDVTGGTVAHGSGSVLGVYEDGAWRGEPMGFPVPPSRGIAASDGRVALQTLRELYVWEDGALAVTPVAGTGLRAVAAADGVLFAAGTPFPFDDVVLDPGPIVLRDAGDGWVPLDTTGLPENAEPNALWADGADDLWFGVRFDEEDGAIFHWDGTTWERVLDTDQAPNWIARLPDGQLYFVRYPGPGDGTDRLWILDGSDAVRVPDMPPILVSAHVLADGTWFASVLEEEETGEGLYSQILQRDPGGDWEEAFRAIWSLPLAGSSDTVWSGYETSWTRGPCAP